jgi:hypothetical protein
MATNLGTVAHYNCTISRGIRPRPSGDIPYTIQAPISKRDLFSIVQSSNPSRTSKSCYWQLCLLTGYRVTSSSGFATMWRRFVWTREMAALGRWEALSGRTPAYSTCASWQSKGSSSLLNRGARVCGVASAPNMINTQPSKRPPSHRSLDSIRFKAARNSRSQGHMKTEQTNNTTSQ